MRAPRYLPNPDPAPTPVSGALRAKVTLEVELTDGRTATYEFHKVTFPPRGPIDTGKKDPGIYLETDRDYNDPRYPLDGLGGWVGGDERFQLLVRGELSPAETKHGPHNTYTVTIKEPAP